MRSGMKVKAVCLFSALLMLGFIGTGCGGSTTDACKNVTNACVTEDSTRCNTGSTGVEICAKNADACLVWTASVTCGDRQTCQSTGAAASCRCDSECATSGETQCNPTQTTIIQTCAADTDGCLFWQDGLNCADTSKFCDDTAEPAVCSETCTDKCTAGTTQCNGTIIQGCAKVGDCYDWVNGTDCDDNGQICSDTSGTAGCYASCSDDCDTIDATQCDGDTVQTCAVGSDGCNDWTDTTDCTTNSQFCVENAGSASCSATCQNRCTDGETQCDGDTVQTCAVQTSTCTDWEDTTTCNAPREACDDSAEPAVCVAQCSDECDTVDAKQCADTVIQTCTLVAATGCNAWVDSKDCADTSQFCDSATVTCVDNCTDDCALTDPNECNAAGTFVMRCRQGNDGCNDWVVATDCTASSQVCYDYTGTAKCETACTDECDLTDLDQCNGTIVETCEAQTNTDGCNDWVVVSDCAGTALPVCDDQGGTVDATCVCADECEAGVDLDYCTGTVITTCGEANDGDTCTEWVPGQDCADLPATPLCDDASGTVAAACVCADECALTDADYCDGNVIMTCEAQTNGDGCNDWVVSDDCSSHTPAQFCDSQADPVACADTCTDDCSMSDYDYCSGTTVMTCGEAGDGDTCLENIVAVDCSTLPATPVCNDHSASEDATCWCVDDCASGEQRCAGNVIENCGEAGDGDTCLDWVTGTDCAANTPPEFCNEDQGTASCVTGCTEILADGSFEGGTPNSDWDETSTNFGTPLCDPSTCGGGSNYARTGTFWAWFGGVDAVEVGTLAQSVTLQAGMPATLSLFLWIPAANGEATDTFVVDVDGTTVFSVSALDVDSYTAYTLVSVDISAFADGNAHTITFTGTTNGAVGGNLSNFFLDDVSVGVGPACCVDVCTDGESFCDGTVPTVCAVGTMGCTEWQAGADCLDNNQECQMVGDPAVATCVACTDECTTVNEQRCNGSVIETCVVGPDTCNDWQAGTDCSQNTPAQYCDDSGANPVCADYTVAVSGDTCGTATPISIPADLPTMNQGDTTCGMTDDYNGTCLDPYDTGLDIIYNLTVTTETIVGILAGTDTDGTGVELASSCPPATGNCIIGGSMAAGNYILGCYRLAPGDYSIMFDTDSSSAACANSITLSLDTFCQCATDETSCIDANTMGTCDVWGTWQSTDCANGCGDIGGGVMGCLMNCTDLSSAVGSPVVTGDNTGATDDSQGSCGGTGGLDVCYTWTAPTTGLYQFDTEGSTGMTDTVLYVYQSGTEIACDDDGGSGALSSALVSVVAGQQYTIVVDGYSSSSTTGSFNLNINEFVVNATEVTVDGGWLASNTGSSGAWFHFAGTAGTTYYVWWDDAYQGSGTYTGDILMSAYHEDMTTIYFAGVDTSYATSRPVAIAAGETSVYLFADPVYGTGTIGVAVSTTDTQP